MRSIDHAAEAIAMGLKSCAYGVRSLVDLLNERECV
jgi:hypothetical protein